MSDRKQPTPAPTDQVKPAPPPAPPSRLQRSNYAGQEEMCSALWDFARDVERAVRAGSTFERDPDGTQYTTTVHLTVVGRAMARIANGFGYRLLKID